ncbi:unnamed protein product, partial [Brassica oleracea]
ASLLSSLRVSASLSRVQACIAQPFTLSPRCSTAVSFSLDRRCSPSAEIDIAGRIRVKIWA